MNLYTALLILTMVGADGSRLSVTPITRDTPERANAACQAQAEVLKNRQAMQARGRFDYNRYSDLRLIDCTPAS